jgi:hypothetical protein
MVAPLYLGFLTWDALFSAHMYAAVWVLPSLARREAREVLLSSSTDVAPRCRALSRVQALPTDKTGNHAYIEARGQPQLSLSLIGLEVRP